MKTLSVKLGVILVGLVIFGYVEVWGADWKFYDTSADRSIIYYYDEDSLKNISENIVRVHTKMVLSPKSRDSVIQKRKKGGLSTKGYEYLEYIILLNEINCANKLFQIISVTEYSKNGEVLNFETFSENWSPILQESVGVSLYKAICRQVIEQSISEAIQDYKKCLETSDKEAAAMCLVSVGNALGNEGRYKEAEKAIREAVKISPKSWITANAYSSLGNILGRQEKYSEAIISLQKAVEIDPELGSAWSDLGVAYFKISKLDKAIQAFKRAISVTNFNEIIDNSYFNLTYIYLIKNESSNTKRNYEILRNKNPTLASKFLSELNGDPTLLKRFHSFMK